MKRNHQFLLLITVAILVVAFSSFDKGGKKKFKGHTKIENISYFLLIEKGTGIQPIDTGGAAFMKIKFKTEMDSVFLDVNETAHVASYPMRIDAPAFKGDFLDCIARLHVGDSASFFISLDSLRKYYPDEFKFSGEQDTMEYLGFAVRIDSIYSRDYVIMLTEKAAIETKKNMELVEKINAIMEPIRASTIEKEPELKRKDASLLLPYLAANKITAKPDTNGIYYQDIVVGTGPAVMTGMTVSVRYVGKYLDGSIFDANTLVEGEEPMTFQLGQGALIAGFENSVLKMKMGGKSTFILPSAMAYNDSLTRVFDVEVIDVKSK